MPILCYHTVEPAWDHTLAIDPVRFEEQCRQLVKRFEVVDVATLDHTRHDNDKVAITFDDGWSGVYEHAWPILRRFGLPFTVFVVADTMVDPDRVVDWVDHAPAKPLDVLTRDQVREMHGAGVSIGSHSLSHQDLTSLDAERCYHDLLQSRDLLEDTLKSPVRSLAYPRGRHNSVVRAAARRAGFEQAFTLPEEMETMDGPLAIPRVGIYPANGNRSFWLKTQPWYLRLRLSRLWALAEKLK